MDDYYRIVKQIYENAVKDLIKDHEDNLEAEKAFVSAYYYRCNNYVFSKMNGLLTVMSSIHT